MKNNKTPEPNFFSILPATVRYNPHLSASAKLLYSEITALTNKEGYCWANNNYFATLFHVSKRSITGWINELIEQNLIQIELDKDSGNARKIFITFGNDVNFPYLWKKTSIGIEKNFQQNNKYNIYTHNTRAREENKIGFDKALSEYGYCQKIIPARDLWDNLPLHEQEKIMDHIRRYVKNHEDHGKRNFLPDFFTYLSEERYNAPSLPYAATESKSGEPDKSNWKMWPDGILRPPDVKRNPEGIYYHEGTNKPYIVLPKNPYQ